MRLVAAVALLATVTSVSAVSAVPAVTGAAAATGSIQVAGNLQYGWAGGQPLLLDAYFPAPDETARPAVVLVHGGSWRVGSKGDFAAEARRFAELGWAAFSVDYRLVSASAFPAEVDDVTASVRWVRAHAGDFGVDPARIGALGASAGGHLVGMLATLGTGPLDTGARIRAAVSWSGPMDLERLAGPGGLPGLTHNLLPCTTEECPAQWDAASPISHVDRSDAPLLLANSTNELIPLDQAKEMAARLRQAKVAYRLDVFPGSRHAQAFGDDDWASTVAFLRRFLEPSAGAAGGQATVAHGDVAAGGLQGAGRTTLGVIAAGALGAAVVMGLAALVVDRRRRAEARAG
ncbi:MAG: alpha/beta hydrolase fold domain-containing protein [Acidimicrobiales bacterium]